MTKRSRSLSPAVAILIDLVLINLAFALGYYVRYELQLIRPVLDAYGAPYSAYLPFQLLYSVLTVILLAVDGIYTPRRGGSWWSDLYCAVNATTTAVVILTAATFVFQPLVYSRLLIFEAGMLTILFISGERLVRRIWQAQRRKRGLGVDRVLIVGAGEVGRAVMRNLAARPELGYQVVGFVDDDPAKGDLGRFRALGSLDDIENVLRAERVDEVIIALPWLYHRKIIDLVRKCELLGARARVVPDLFQLALSRVDMDDIGGLPLIGIKQATIPRPGRWIKRGIDVAAATLLFLISLPLLPFIALIIKLETPGPVLFRQTRIGERGRPFTLYKFRSMRDGAENELESLMEYNEASGPLFKIRDDPRLTRFGRLLRRFSLDELPQIINVLRGDLSMVGPRPNLPHEVAQYQPWHRQRLEVRPGLTGLAQVSGRSDLSFDEMCLLDIYYIENWSLWLDVEILLRTVPHVLCGQGAY